MPGLNPSNIDEIVNLAQRLEEVMHELRAADDDTQLSAHTREIVTRLNELVA